MGRQKGLVASVRGGKMSFTRSERMTRHGEAAVLS